jgi:electron transport complex protein RnfB
MHTVIIDECTGCDLCVEPCPVDCIDMVPVKTGIKQWQWPSPPVPNGLIATDKTYIGSNHGGAA